MRWLRSRWTVVALVPAFFLASFALVSALAEGSDAPTPAAAEADGSAGSAPHQVTVLSPTTIAESAPGDGTTPGAGGDGDGRAAPAPPPGTIAVDYGRWDGMFDISDTEIVPDFGFATVTGQFRYLGGVGCQVGFVLLRGRFYNGAGQAIGQGTWESIWVTGNGAEVPQREPLYLEFYGGVSEAPESARMRFTRVDCL
jgi:hypothetical protein